MKYLLVANYVLFTDVPPLLEMGVHNFLAVLGPLDPHRYVFLSRWVEGFDISRREHQKYMYHVWVGQGAVVWARGLGKGRSDYQHRAWDVDYILHNRYLSYISEVGSPDMDKKAPHSLNSWQIVG